MKSILMLLSFLPMMKHDFHVSITYAELNPSSGNLEISMKVFADDLEEAIRSTSDKDFRLPASNDAQADSLIFSLINGHFSLKADGRSLPLRYVGRELEQEIIFIYMEVPEIKELKRISIRNSLFFNRFDDQSNIVNIKVKDQLQSVFLEASDPQKTLVFR